MTLTYQTIITWPSREDEMNISVDTSRQTLLQTMLSQGKTDGVAHTLGEGVTSRHWLDESAATEYVSGITTIAQENNITIVSALIEPIN